MDDMSEQEIERLNMFFAQYRDRGVKKWRGFFLSEHTTQYEKHMKAYELSERLPQQPRQQIEHYLERSIKYNKILEVQLNTFNELGTIEQHVWGVYRGKLDDDNLLVGEQVVAFDNIRHIRIHSFQKWSEANPFEDVKSNLDEDNRKRIDGFFDEYFNDENWIE